MFGEGAPTRREIMAVPPDKQMATLELRVVSGVGLSARDGNGQSDPYCEVHAWTMSDTSCSHVWRTATKLKTLDPKWGEGETMHFTGTEAMLHLIVFDWDKIGVDDFLGEVALNLAEYADGKWHSLQLELQKLTGATSKEAVTGSLEIDLRFSVHAKR